MVFSSPFCLWSATRLILSVLLSLVFDLCFFWHSSYCFFFFYFPPSSLWCFSFPSLTSTCSEIEKDLSEHVYKCWFPSTINRLCILSWSGKKISSTKMLINKGAYNQEGRAVDCFIHKSLLLFCLISCHHTIQPGEVRWYVNIIFLSDIILHHRMTFQTNFSSVLSWHAMLFTTQF